MPSALKILGLINIKKKKEKKKERGDKLENLSVLKKSLLVSLEIISVLELLL